MDKCFMCGKELKSDGFGTGYGELLGRKCCYDCCAKYDRNILLSLKPKSKDRTYLYWDGKEVTNWPGTLRILPNKISEGRHNIAKTRTDVWFTLEGKRFHGVQLGDMNQICSVQALSEGSEK